MVVEPAAIAEAEERGLNRLYVVLTRAVSRLDVLHARPLPFAVPDGWSEGSAGGGPQWAETARRPEPGGRGSGAGGRAAARWRGMDGDTG
ncbi:hypothetical protein [Streptomyces sp. GC420]|uniref:hypothetical protein n=1 Tax=Streptomyces sp. GC420 TaxID=2697568 RepID=UPI0014150F82|nr:hypothetical protein [Streptomyces sp. GC420]NBM17706.1 hypothetical protein [Streptomyces sp. GC420]